MGTHSTGRAVVHPSELEVVLRVATDGHSNIEFQRRQQRDLHFVDLLEIEIVLSGYVREIGVDHTEVVQDFGREHETREQNRFPVAVANRQLARQVFHKFFHVYVGRDYALRFELGPGKNE